MQPMAVTRRAMRELQAGEPNERPVLRNDRHLVEGESQRSDNRAAQGRPLVCEPLSMRWFSFSAVNKSPMTRPRPRHRSQRQFGCAASER